MESETIPQISSFYVPEPYLIFANKARFKDPKAGLFLFGPYGQYGDASAVNITANAGIIGTSKSIGNLLDFFTRLHSRIQANSVGGVDFPGLGLDGRLRFDVHFDEQWEETIDKTNIDECKSKDKRTDKALYLLDLIDDKLASLHQKQPNPDIVFITLPAELHKMCILPGQIGLKITLANRRFSSTPTEEQIQGDYDFHNIIKVMGMKHHFPTQFVLPTTLDLERKLFVQDLATRAWNLSVAAYYKSKGVPWKLAELESGTCYAGISFYRECSSDGKQSMRASVAQIFLATGETLILRGDPFEWSELDARPHLNTKQAQALRDQIINAYNKTHKEPPERLVIHKSTEFLPEETKGFMEADNAIKQIDLLTLTQSPIYWYRDGSYPIVRGNVAKVSGSEFFIFTLGYIPQLQTFPKPGIPIPVRVRAANLDSTERKMCKEILSLTRLNWNNADFCDQMPITISASDRIGDILSEARIRDVEISTEYKYYM
ncbi:MAG TPA: hypothetical protein VIH48_05500 [Candidatus Bathyarchaeia archaeon]